MRSASSLSICVLLSLTSGWAVAGDNIQASVSPVEAWPEPVLKLNGNDTTQGTIQLFYYVEAYSFPVGPFTRFAITLDDVHLSGADNAVYPATLSLAQNGSNNLVLSPDADSFYLGGLGPVGSTEVLVTIPPGVSNEDGTDLVGNLNFSVPGRNKIGTPTSVQVHIRLKHPVGCLHLFNFITDTSFETTYEAATVNLNARKGWVSSMNPSQASDNVLVANACAWDESFDLLVQLDSRFDTSPNGNPGNAVHTYSALGVIDEDSFDIAAFDGGNGQGQNLCLQDLKVAAGTSFLATVHSALQQHLPIAELGTAPFSFAVTATEANTACAGALSASMYPNPLSIDLPFTVE